MMEGELAGGLGLITTAALDKVAIDAVEGIAKRKARRRKKLKVHA